MSENFLKAETVPHVRLKAGIVWREFPAHDAPTHGTTTEKVDGKLVRIVGEATNGFLPVKVGAGPVRYIPQFAADRVELPKLDNLMREQLMDLHMNGDTDKANAIGAAYNWTAPPFPDYEGISVFSKMALVGAYRTDPEGVLREVAAFRASPEGQRSIAIERGLRERQAARDAELRAQTLPQPGFAEQVDQMTRQLLGMAPGDLRGPAPTRQEQPSADMRAITDQIDQTARQLAATK